LAAEKLRAQQKQEEEARLAEQQKHTTVPSNEKVTPPEINLAREDQLRGIFANVLKHEWTEPDFDFRQKPRMIPRFLSAVICTLREMSFFKKFGMSSEGFTKVLGMLCNYLVKGPSYIVPSVILLPTLLLANRERFGLDSDVVDEFLLRFQKALDRVMHSFLSVGIKAADKLCEEMVNAEFDQQKLLAAWRAIFAKVARSLHYGEQVNHALRVQFLKDIDDHLFLRILSNPSKFTFSNAVAWNSFLTTLDFDSHITLTKVQGLVAAMLLIPNLAEDPASKDQACPMIDVNVLAYIMVMFSPDHVFPNVVNATKFMNYWGVRAAGDPTPALKAEVKPVYGFSPVDGWSGLDLWKLTLTQDLFAQFPFLKNYVICV
jgi:hypothetical protein